MTLALQAPPLPPLPPSGVMAANGGPGDMALVLIVLAALATAIIILGPVMRAFARRLEGRGGATELEGEMDALRTRVAQLEQGQNHLAELEERLDFAERLLAQTREPNRLHP